MKNEAMITELKEYEEQTVDSLYVEEKELEMLNMVSMTLFVFEKGVRIQGSFVAYGEMRFFEVVTARGEVKIMSHERAMRLGAYWQLRTSVKVNIISMPSSFEK